MKTIAVILYGDQEFSVGLGETDADAAHNAVRAYCGDVETWQRMARRPAIDIYDLVDGMRLNHDQETPYRTYEGPIGDTAAPAPGGP